MSLVLRCIHLGRREVVGRCKRVSRREAHPAGRILEHLGVQTAVGSLTSRAGELRSAPSGPDDLGRQDSFLLLVCLAWAESCGAGCTSGGYEVGTSGCDHGSSGGCEVGSSSGGDFVHPVLYTPPAIGATTAVAGPSSARHPMRPTAVLLAKHDGDHYHNAHTCRVAVTGFEVDASGDGMWWRRGLAEKAPAARPSSSAAASATSRSCTTPLAVRAASHQRT